MCRQNSVSGRPENSLHQERTHAECFFHSKCSEHLASRWKGEIEESVKAGSRHQDTSGLSRQCSATGQERDGCGYPRAGVARNCLSQRELSIASHQDLETASSVIVGLVEYCL